MGMLRLVRAFTKRDAIIKFEGCYHGHADSFLVQAGSGVATLGLPDSPGVPSSSTATTYCAQYNDLESVEAILKAHDCAAVILEPVVGNSGFIKPKKEVSCVVSCCVVSCCVVLCRVVSCRVVLCCVVLCCVVLCCVELS